MSSGDDIARVWLHDRYVAKLNAAGERGDPADVESLLDDHAADDPDELFAAWLSDSVERAVRPLNG